MDRHCQGQPKVERREKPRRVAVPVRLRGGGDSRRHQHPQRTGARAYPVLEVRRMTVTLRRENNLWCLREARTGLYLCGFIDRANAVEQARREGWEIV
jgi:hypothetical protein